MWGSYEVHFAFTKLDFGAHLHPKLLMQLWSANKLNAAATMQVGIALSNMIKAPDDQIENHFDSNHKFEFISLIMPNGSTARSPNVGHAICQLDQLSWRLKGWATGSENAVVSANWLFDLRMKECDCEQEIQKRRRSAWSMKSRWTSFRRMQRELHANQKRCAFSIRKGAFCSKWSLSPGREVMCAGWP